MRSRFVNFGLVLFLSSTAYVQAQPTPVHTYRAKPQVRRISVLDYFSLLPSLGIGYGSTFQERRELLQPVNRPIVDVRHDYVLVHPDSSPAEQIAVFRTRNKPDLLAVSLPDFQSDYNDFTLYRLQNGKLRDVTREALPMPSDTGRLLYELPRFGTTIRVFRFNIETQSRRHVFDLRWRGDHFVKVG